MPIKPPTLCSVPSCRASALKFGRCELHSRRHNREGHKNNAFYHSWDWKCVRLQRLEDYPLCEICERAEEPRITPATEVDHVIPIEAGGAPLDQANLQSLCKSCHSAKTWAEVNGAPALQEAGS